MLLCAGLGTRLRPLTEQLPKPLVPIGDRSILEHIAERLARAGFDSLVLNTHWLPETFPSVLTRLPIPARTVHEPEIRGTAGGIAGARHLLGSGPILLWNGDILVEPPVAELMEQVGDGLCMAIAPRPQGMGSVGCDAMGRVVRLRGERFGEETAGGDYVGVAALGERCLRELPAKGCLVGDWALPELRRGGRVRAVEIDGTWVDAGDRAAYLAANLDWLNRRGLEAWCGPEALVGPGVTLRESVIGAGAQVSGKGELYQVVVWPGAEVEAPLERSVVTTQSQIVSTE